MDGCEGDLARLERIRFWIQAQALDVVGFQELNGWDQDRLTSWAGKWGHPYSKFMSCKHTGLHYDMGISATVPIEVVEELVEGFWHGALHVKINLHHFQDDLAEADKQTTSTSATPSKLSDDVISASGPSGSYGSSGSSASASATHQAQKPLVTDEEYLHLIVVHLHPHSAAQRRIEATKIAQIATAHDKLIALGDFNTLSPLDDYHYKSVNLTRALQKKPALRAKFLQEDLTIDYTPMMTLLHVLNDLDYFDYLQSHRSMQNAPMSEMFREARPPFLPSVPTPINFDASHAAPMRLDYVMATETVFEYEVLSCTIIHSEETHTLSDHYPIVAVLRANLSVVDASP